MVLLLGEATRFDNDWVPFEIQYAVDQCRIPIIVTYLDVKDAIFNPDLYEFLWPAALKARIFDQTASCIHIPFKKEILKMAIEQFSHTSKPIGAGRGYYSVDAYKQCGFPL